MSAHDVRPLTEDDLDWVGEVTRARRERLAPHAPRFWRPSADATARHRAFLAHLVRDPATITVRTDHGYLVALDRDGYHLVDDMDVVPDEHWTTEGLALLTRAREAGPLRFVVPAFEARRLDAALDLGLEPAEIWWHRDLEPGTGLNVVVEDPAVAVEGATGHLVPAPPVYDPGGTVLLVASADSAEALHRIEQSAARRGASVAVVTQAPSDPALTVMLGEAGYTLTTFFFASPGGAASTPRK